jgi:hypothetical protein
MSADASDVKPDACHQCGFDINRGYALTCPDGARYQFCDTDCLIEWLRGGQRQFELKLAQDIAALAASVNGRGIS